MTTLTFGGWYQRTTLHLTEIARFLFDGASELDLDKTKLKNLQKALNIKNVQRVSEYLEKIEFTTKEGIRARYYEDGLYILELQTTDIKKDTKILKDYFENKFKPAIDYLFSLGAPTPKILSNMLDTHPLVVGITKTNPKTTKINERIYGKIYSKTISKNAIVYKTPEYIITITSKKSQKGLEDLVDMQIFFREFKMQLHKYLNIHRKIWEEIEDIKERKEILGKDASKLRNELESYLKTVSLIKNRINQMGTYAKTRASLAKTLKIQDELITHFEYKHEDLLNTLEYIKEIWEMTLEYVKSAIEIVKEIKNKTAVKGIKSIQLLVSVGAVAGILRLANPKYIPVFNTSVAIFLISLFAIAYLIDWILKYNANHKKYKLQFKERNKDI